MIFHKTFFLFCLIFITDLKHTFKNKLQIYFVISVYRLPEQKANNGLLRKKQLTGTAIIPVSILHCTVLYAFTGFTCSAAQAL